MDMTLVDLILNQGPAWFMAAIFAYLYVNEKRENAKLTATLLRILAAIAKLPGIIDDDGIVQVETLDLTASRKEL